MRAALVLVLAVGATFPTLGCSKTEEPRSTQVTETPPAPSPSPPAISSAATAPAIAPTPTVTATTNAVAPQGGELKWDVPAAWKEVSNPSPMRKATYKITKVGADTEDAEMSVIQSGGGLDPNIQRWVGQFEDGKDSLKRTSKKVGGFDVTVVEIRGKFAGGGMPGMPPTGPKVGYALLGAIVEGVEPAYFFKMTGPEKTVASARKDFDKLVGSFRRP